MGYKAATLRFAVVLRVCRQGYSVGDLFLGLCSIGNNPTSSLLKKKMRGAFGEILPGGSPHEIEVAKIDKEI